MEYCGLSPPCRRSRKHSTFRPFFSALSLFPHLTQPDLTRAQPINEFPANAGLPVQVRSRAPTPNKTIMVCGFESRAPLAHLIPEGRAAGNLKPHLRPPAIHAGATGPLDYDPTCSASRPQSDVRLRSRSKTYKRAIDSAISRADVWNGLIAPADESS
jgi:hypothetical protein